MLICGRLEDVMEEINNELDGRESEPIGDVAVKNEPGARAKDSRGKRVSISSG